MRFLPFLFLTSFVNDIEWSEHLQMPHAQAGGAAAYISDELIVAGGTTWTGDVKSWLADVQIYNPVSNTWRFGPKLPVPLAYGPYVSSPAGLEIFGGTDGQTARRDQWKLKTANGGWVRTGSMPADALLGRAAQVGASVFVFGGCSDVAELGTCSDAVWRRNGNGKWLRASTIPSGPLALAAAAVSRSSVYLFGGCSIDTGGKLVNHRRASRYDSISNEWKPVRELPAGNRGLSALAYDDRSIFLFGGYTDSGFSSEVLLYDIPSDTYRKLKPMPLAVAGVEFVLNGRTLYGAGGEDRMRSRSARLFEANLAVTAQ
jgi:N-acetylneuraminic acid mutarotase